MWAGLDMFFSDLTDSRDLVKDVTPKQNPSRRTCQETIGQQIQKGGRSTCVLGQRLHDGRQWKDDEREGQEQGYHGRACTE